MRSFTTLFFSFYFFTSFCQGIDQSNFNTSSNTTVESFFPDTIAQSFEAGVTGQLTDIEIKVETYLCSASDSIPIELFLYEGDSIVGNSIVINEYHKLPGGLARNSNYKISLNTPLDIELGKRYVFAIKDVGVTNCAGQSLSGNILYGADYQNNYTGGTAYEMLKVGTNTLPWDIDFKTYVVPKTVGLDNDLLEVGIEVYPNPAGNYISIQHISDDYTATSILNSKGQMVSKLSNDEHVINITNLKSGVYLLKLVSKKDNVKTIKFIKR